MPSSIPKYCFSFAASLAGTSLVSVSCWAQQAVGAGTTELAEVVVTATKRAEKLQEVPVSVTALSAATLETQGVLEFSDYMTLVPGLSDYSNGAEGHGPVILRGLNTGYYQTSNTVGFYIVDIPFSAVSPLSVGTDLTPDPGLVDIDHIEVLNGPQATLYGATTLGGLHSPHPTDGSLDLSAVRICAFSRVTMAVPCV
jgi:outer membrane receptor protein involved in Fe transport